MANVFRRESIAQIVDFGLNGLNDLIEQKQRGDSTNEHKQNDSNKQHKNKHGLKASDMEMDTQVKNLANELKHVRLEIESNKARVKELQQTITNVKNDKFEHETNLVSELQISQADLSNQLKCAIQSKFELCEKTSNEIDRLRKIIKLGKLDSLHFGNTI